MGNTIRIALADDHKMFLQTLANMLNGEEDMEVVITAANGKELLSQMKTTDVDIVLLDLDMPILDGRAAFPILKQYFSKAKIIILSFHDSLVHMRKFLSEGANAYILKGSDFSVLLSAIRKVNKEGYFFCDRVSKELLDKWNEDKLKRTGVINKDPLTDREKEIVRLICAGKSNGEMSLELNLSQRTVENHRMRISKKIGSKSTAHIFEYAVKNGVYIIEL